MNVSNPNVFLEQIKQELINKEIENVETRCAVVSKEGTKTMRALLIAVNMSEACTKIKALCVQIPKNEYTDHIIEWKGLSLSYKARKIPVFGKEYRKGAINWANGRRALILATKVFPAFIEQSVEYCMDVTKMLNFSHPDKANLFFQLSRAALISSILKSNVQLNQRAAETPLICQNSVTKYGFDKILLRYLPENLRIGDIATALLNEETQGEQLNCHIMNQNMTSIRVMEKSQKKTYKLQANVFGAFQKAFTDLYNNYLAQYRHCYMPAENAKIDQAPTFSPPQSALFELNNLTDQITQNLQIYSGEDLNVLRTKIQQVQQIIQNEMTQRSCQTYTNVLSNTAVTYDNKNIVFDHHLIAERSHTIHMNNVQACGRDILNGSQDDTCSIRCQSYIDRTLKTTDSFPNTSHIPQITRKPLNEEYYLSSPSSGSSVEEIPVPKLPQKRRLSFDHYLDDNMNSKRMRHNNNEDNVLMDPFLDSVFYDDLESGQLWSQQGSFPAQFDNDLSF